MTATGIPNLLAKDLFAGSHTCDGLRDAPHVVSNEDVWKYLTTGGGLHA